MKKIISISIFVMLLAFTTLLSTTSMAADVAIDEDFASCSAGIDNDIDGEMGFAGDPDCFQFVEGVEEATCFDGMDNDFNGLSDSSDPSCAAFAPATTTPVFATEIENTQELCSDSKDNDFNGLSDSSDPSCAAFAPVATTTTPVVTTPTTGGGTSGPSFGGGSGPSFSSAFGGGLTSGTPVSNVISTGTPVSATSSEPMCEDMFKTHMKKGAKNNVNEVKKLQSFLNKELMLKIPTTGFFGTLTENAVKAFQSKYKDTTLTPWGIVSPTGYFYKTTQRQANLILCSSAVIPMPILN